MAAGVGAGNGGRIGAAYRTVAPEVPAPVPKLHISRKFHLIKRVNPQPANLVIPLYNQMSSAAGPSVLVTDSPSYDQYFSGK